MPRGPKGEKRPADEQQKSKALYRWENEGGAKAKPTEAPARRKPMGQAHGRYCHWRG